MRRKSIGMKCITVLLCGIMLAGSLTGCKNSSQVSGKMIPKAAKEAKKEVDNPTRTHYVKLSKDLEKKFKKNPNNTAVALEYAEKLLQLGDLAKSQEVLAPILAGKVSNPQAIYLSAQINYLSGKYEQSEELYNTLINEHPEYKARAEYAMGYVYYQTNQYQKIKKLSQENTSGSSVDALMRAFGSRTPYKVSWAGKKETTIPFRVTEPLPVVQVEVNGELKNFIIDTGAAETYLNESIAKAMGIQPIATDKSDYAGGIEVETKFGILDSMKLNGVTLESLPINIANIDHFSAMYDFEISGVFGTGVFAQFHVTMDYINGELILKPRGEHTKLAAGVSEVPFVMAGSHFMLWKAIINGKEMYLFPDSGLAADASLLLPKGAMDYAGIPIPELHNSTEEDGVGGLGGSDFSSGYFTANTYQMGDLPTVKDMKGMFGVFPEMYYFNKDFGLFVDGIISHNYLKDYKWTIDFDSMTMSLSK